MELSRTLKPKRLQSTLASRGFTLVEMLVVLSIIAIITMISLFGQSTFNRSVLLTDTAYTVALSLREMQSLGLSSRKFGAVQNAGYGAYFATNNTSSYILFADIGGSSPPTACPKGTSGQPDWKPGNCRYEVATDGLVQRYSFSNRFSLSHICGTASSNGTRYCSTNDSLSSIDVVFLRSNTTDTIMTGQRSAGPTALSKAEIYIRSNNGGDTRGICVSQVGQVSVAFGTCP